MVNEGSKVIEIKQVLRNKNNAGRDYFTCFFAISCI